MIPTTYWASVPCVLRRFCLSLLPTSILPPAELSASFKLEPLSHLSAIPQVFAVCSGPMPSWCFPPGLSHHLRYTPVFPQPSAAFHRHLFLISRSIFLVVSWECTLHSPPILCPFILTKLACISHCGYYEAALLTPLPGLALVSEDRLHHAWFRPGRWLNLAASVTNSKTFPR